MLSKNRKEEDDMNEVTSISLLEDMKAEVRVFEVIFIHFNI